MLHGSRNTQTTPEYYQPDTVEPGDLEQHKLRVLIDEVATLRGLTIQMSLRLMALAAAPDDGQRQLVCEEFRALRAQFDANMDMLFGTAPPDPEHQDHIAWIRKIVAGNPDRRAQLLGVEAAVASIGDAIDAGRMPGFAEARRFFDENWPVIRDKMTEVIWDLWADLDAQKSAAIERNGALQTTLQNTLSDIKRFSCAIRMIAINSAVLATRPEDAGAGFQVISKEVKQLSEDIDRSTNRAKETISGLI